MYNGMSFATVSGVVKYLNSNHINKEDIIALKYSDNHCWMLVYYTPN